MERHFARDRYIDCTLWAGHWLSLKLEQLRDCPTLRSFEMAVCSAVNRGKMYLEECLRRRAEATGWQ
jgi:hypothetical protein